MVLAVVTLTTTAQNRTITGTLTDSETKEGVLQATVQLLKTDSTYIKGVLSDDSGRFKILAPSNGSYILKVSSVGYKTLFKTVKIADDKDVALGQLKFNQDAIMLKGATITGQAAKVVVKNDTFVYNASAYRTPEGSVIEELVKKLPGAKVDDEGKITINGKEVKKVLVDGKEFMTGDTKTALKNLPTSIVDKIKAYDEKSDMARVTGIDDGEEQTVLDFGVKKGMNKGMFGNIDLAVGTHDRYAERLMGATFQDGLRAMLFGNINNTNDMGFPGGGGGGRFGGGGQGLNTAKMISGNMNYEKKDKLQIDGSIGWNHSDGNNQTKNSSENFVSQAGSFSNSDRKNLTRSNSWTAQMRLEWQPDTMTNIMFRPNFTYSTSDGNSTNTSASFNSDPYLYVSDPLTEESIATLAGQRQMVNRSQDRSLSYSRNKTAGAMLQLNRKFGSRGRNVTLRADVNYSDQDSKNLSTNNVHLYQVKDRWGNDSTYQTNRYSVTPTESWNYSVRAAYSEPIFKAVFLQLSYKFTYKYNKSTRSTYDFSNMGEDFFSGVQTEYRGWGNYISRLQNPLESYLDDDLSRLSEYKNYIHDIQLTLRILRKKYKFNVGFLVQPQKTRFIQDYQGVSVDTVRTVVNVSPTLDFRYRISDMSNLRINYQGTTSQPSMTDLLSIRDDSDPLNISEGNPGLKPSFTNSFQLFYDAYLQKHQQAVMTNLSFSTTRNSISRMVMYDEITGGRTTRPENINGNWNASGAFMFNTALDSVGRWSVNTFTNLNYNNYVGYLSLDGKNSQKNTTRTTMIGENLSGSFRNDWLDVTLDGSFDYTHTRNLLQAQSNLNTWQFSYGGSVNVYLPWGMSLSTDMHENSRRGYNDASMNTNELIWNAQLSQSFLKGKCLTVSLQYYDILQQQSNFSRTIDAMQRSDTQYNSINSYAMLHVIYRMNVFGGKEARRANKQRRDNMPPPDGGRRGEYMGPPPGMGGGRPPMRM